MRADVLEGSVCEETRDRKPLEVFAVLNDGSEPDVERLVGQVVGRSRLDDAEPEARVVSSVSGNCGQSRVSHLAAKVENRVEFWAACGDTDEALFGQRHVRFCPERIRGKDSKLSKILARVREDLKPGVLDVIQHLQCSSEYLQNKKNSKQFLYG